MMNTAIRIRLGCHEQPGRVEAAGGGGGDWDATVIGVSSEGARVGTGLNARPAPTRWDYRLQPVRPLIA